MPNKITLLNLFLNDKYKNNILKDINFDIITQITCKHETSSTEYESYNNDTNKYTTRFTEPEGKFIFNIYIKGNKKPIQIICKDSRELEHHDMMSYHYRGTNEYIDELLNDFNLNNFIRPLSRNKLFHYLTSMGFILGNLVNNNLDKLDFEIC